MPAASASTASSRSIDEVGSRASAERHVAAGRVTVDGLVAGKALRLRGGEQIELELEDPGPALEPVELDLVVPFEDEYLLVVDKPAGLVTHPASGLREATLVHGLLARGIAGRRRPRAAGSGAPARPRHHGAARART